MDQREESGRQYTLFVDSTAAIGGVRTDVIGPGQRFAVAAIERATRIRVGGNDVTVRWVPAHQGGPGNEEAEEYAKSVTDEAEPRNAVPDDYRWETSPSHMTRVATEARAQSTAQWIAERDGDPRRKYRPPRGKGIRHKLLQRAPKPVAGRYYQLLSGTRQ